MEDRQKGNRCQGSTKDGKPCSAAATATGLCFFHSNPKKAAELGRKGGQRNRKLVLDDVDPLPALETMKAVRDVVARLTVEVYTGKTHPSIARGLALLLQLQLRVLYDTEIEERLGRVEQKCTESNDGSSLSDSGDAALGPVQKGGR